MAALRTGFVAPCFAAGRFFGCFFFFGNGGNTCGKLLGMYPSARNLSCLLEKSDFFLVSRFVKINHRFKIKICFGLWFSAVKPLHAMMVLKFFGFER